MTTGALIVHGARVPFARMSGIYQWTSNLQDYLASQGFSPALVFIWSGGFLRAHKFSVQVSLVRQLTEMWDILRVEHGHLSILAKSQGAFVVEGALRLLNQRPGVDLEVSTLLRVATPDFREKPAIPRVKRIVDLVSKADRHYDKGVTLNKALGPQLPEADSGILSAKHWVEDLSHHDFNHNRLVVLDGNGTPAPLFEIYRDLLRGSSPNERALL